MCSIQGSMPRDSPQSITVGLRNTYYVFKIELRLKCMEPTYRKGNYDATARIAQNHPTAVKNATTVLQTLLQEGIPCLEDTDERNRWLCTKCKTFSTVQEVIVFLESLQSQDFIRLLRRDSKTLSLFFMDNYIKLRYTLIKVNSP